MNQIFFILCVFAVSCVVTPQVKAQYSIANSVFGNGYTPQANSSYQLKGTLGQAISQKEIIINQTVSKLILTGFNNSSLVPTRYELSQNYPNPFNPETSISYDVPKTSFITIEVFNLLGQKLRTLVNEKKNPGTYQILWNGLDDQGQAVSSGVYLYKMQAGDFAAMKKMVLVR